MTAPNLSATAFWDVNRRTLNYEINARFVTEKVMNYGLWADIVETLHIYGRERVKQKVTQAEKTLPLRYVCPYTHSVSMLHLATVESGTLELLKQLMKLPALDSFALAGGTEEQADPMVLNAMTWSEVKLQITQAVRQLL